MLTPYSGPTGGLSELPTFIPEPVTVSLPIEDFYGIGIGQTDAVIRQEKPIVRLFGLKESVHKTILVDSLQFCHSPGTNCLH